MVQCEMCGTETDSPSQIKVEGAELAVCDACTDFGTELRTESDSGGSSKYSTSSSSGTSSSSSSSSAGRTSTSSGSTSTGSSSSTSSGSSSGGGGGRRRDTFEDLDELAQDFDERVRTAREQAGLSQDELAQDINEKASLIRKIERGETLPTDDLQDTLERYFDIDLSAGGSLDDEEWEADTDAEGYTLGDMVQRKD